MAQAKPVTVTLMDTPSVRARVGEAIEVVVPAKGATGHVWRVRPGSDVKVLGQRRAPSETSFGGGGVEVFTVEPTRKGHLTMVFELAAPWRQEPAEQHSFSIDADD
jgi:predicted secreted protein